MAIHTQLIPTKKDGKKQQSASCRAVCFSLDGQRIYSGGSAGDLCAINAERACTFSSSTSQVMDDTYRSWQIEGASEGSYTPFHVLHPFTNTGNQNLFATGDEMGGVRIWDERLLGGNMSSASHTSNSATTTKGKRPPGCVLSWKENDDYISGFDHSEDGYTLLASSADGRLSVFDLRKATTKLNQGEQPFRLSDDQEDELLSVQIIKHGRKVVCGTQEGVLGVFSWGTWGDVSDRFPGHPASIDALLKVDEDTLLTGSSDGYIRVVQIHPDKLVGVLGGTNGPNNDSNHGGFPVEKLQFNANRNVVGSVSHDNFVRLWDARVLFDDDENHEDRERNLQIPPAAALAVAPKGTNGGGMNSDDEWDDMDDNNDNKAIENRRDDDDDDNSEDNDNDEEDEKGENDDDDGDDDSDDSRDEKPETANQKRAKRLKTENERFFDDL